MKNWADFWIGVFAAVIVFLTIFSVSAVVEAVQQKNATPPIPTVVTMDYGDQHFLVFYDKKGNICDILETYEFDEEFD